jgi:exopolysaccharide biosynthesis polyprenyl glycosylphosphotransferase
MTIEGDRLLGRLDVAPRSRSAAGAAIEVQQLEDTGGSVTLGSVHALRAPARRTERRLAGLLLGGRGWVGLCAVADVIALALALTLTFRWPGEPLPVDQALVLFAFPPLVMAMLALRGMYRPRLRVSVLDGVAPLVGAISVATMTLVVIDIYLAGGDLATGVYPHIWTLSLAFVAIGRASAVGAQHIARERGLAGTPTLVIGAGLVGRKLAARLQRDPQYGLRPVGFVDDSPLFPGAGPVGLPLLGGTEDLEEIIRRTGAEHILVAFSSMTDRSLLPLVRRASAAGLAVSLVPRMFESVNDRLSYESLGGIPVLRLRGTDPRGWQFDVKHMLDRVLALALLIVCAPLLLSLALGVRLSSAGPVVFRQPRVGRDGRIFDLFKFRSMRAPEGESVFEVAAGNAPGGVEGVDRRTGIGRLLRRTSLDELPQLLNVLRGDMSLVGPRPERPEYAEQFRRDIERYGDRDRVKAGMTGWAQVHGLRGQTSIEDRAEWDNHYIEHWSLWLDLKILVMTVRAIFAGASE